MRWIGRVVADIGVASIAIATCLLIAPHLPTPFGAEALFGVAVLLTAWFAGLFAAIPSAVFVREAFQGGATPATQWALTGVYAGIAILTMFSHWLFHRRQVKRDRVMEARSALQEDIDAEIERTILELRATAESQIDQHKSALEHAMRETVAAWTREIVSIESASIRQETAALCGEERERHVKQMSVELEAAIDTLRTDAAEHLQLAEEKIDADAARKIAAAATLAEEKSRQEIFHLMAETERNTAEERDAIMAAAQKQIAEAHAEVRAAAREMLDFERGQLEEIAAARNAFAIRMKREWEAFERGSQEELEAMKRRLDEALADGKQRLEEAIAAEMESELQQRRASMIAAIDEQLESERIALRRQAVESINQERAVMQQMIRRFGAEREKLAREIGR